MKNDIWANSADFGEYCRFSRQKIQIWGWSPRISPGIPGDPNCATIFRPHRTPLTHVQLGRILNSRKKVRSNSSVGLTHAKMLHSLSLLELQYFVRPKSVRGHILTKYWTSTDRYWPSTEFQYQPGTDKFWGVSTSQPSAVGSEVLTRYWRNGLKWISKN